MRIWKIVGYSDCFVGGQATKIPVWEGKWVPWWKYIYTLIMAKKPNLRKMLAPGYKRPAVKVKKMKVRRKV